MPFMSQMVGSLTNSVQEAVMNRPYTALGDSTTNVTHLEAKGRTQEALERLAQLPTTNTKLEVNKAGASARRLEAIADKKSALARYQLLQMRQENRILATEARYAAGMMGEQLKREELISAHSTEVSRFTMQRSATRESHAAYYGEMHDAGANIFNLIS